MKTIPIVYATLTGNTEYAAEELQKQLSGGVPEYAFELKNISSITPDYLAHHERIIFGASTWNYDLNPDSEVFIKQLTEQASDFSSITFAMFGLRDSSYEEFCPAIPLLKNALEKCGAKIYADIYKIDGFPTPEALQELVAWAKKFLLQ